jgi:anti-sigma B factor antagonist
VTTADGCTVELASEGDAYVVSLVGALDHGTAPPVRASLLGAVHSDPAALVVDLAGLRFLDSSGIGLLVEIRRRALDRGVPMALRRPQRAVRVVLEMTGILPSVFAERETPTGA